MFLSVLISSEAFRIGNELPKTNVGKILRRALKEKKSDEQNAETPPQ